MYVYQSVRELASHIGSRFVKAKRCCKMAQAHETTDVGASSDISIVWRAFQILGLLVALSWLASFFAYSGPYAWVPGLFAGEIPSYGTVVFDLSPVLSVVLITLAVAPDRLRFIEGSDWRGYVARALLFVLPVLWMLNVFVGTRSVMIDKLIATPLAESGMIPLFGGVFLHVVFQHWFQAISAIAFALVPEKFGALTESSTPAGVQCAVVNCE